MSVGRQRNDLAMQWFENTALAEAFKKIKNREFETVRILVIGSVSIY
jgi:hypothetical protein